MNQHPTEQQISSTAPDALQIEPARRDDAVARCRAQFDAWPFAWPDAEPLVLDFGLGDFEHTGLIEFWLANETAAGYCGKLMFLFPGQACPRHHHRVKHETFCPMFGSIAVGLNDEQMSLSPGQTLAIPPGEPHGFAAIDSAILLLELSMPCDVRDNYFEDDQINQWLLRVAGQPTSQPETS